MIENISELYEVLQVNMSDRRWWNTDDPWEIMIGAVLVQNTNWKNVDYSLTNVKAATGFIPEKLLALSDTELEQLIRPSGFYKNKTQTLKRLFAWSSQTGFDLSKLAQREQDGLRSELLAIKGIGEETADVLLVYVLDKAFFIADKYAQRIFSRLGVAEPLNYRKLQGLIDFSGFTSLQAQKFHGWLVEYGQRYLKNDQLWQEGFLSDFQLEMA